MRLKRNDCNSIADAYDSIKNNQHNLYENIFIKEESGNNFSPQLLQNAKAVGINSSTVEQIFAAAKERNYNLSDQEIFKLMDDSFKTMYEFLFNQPNNSDNTRSSDDTDDSYVSNMNSQMSSYGMH